MASLPNKQELARLSVTERLELMDDLWASLAPEAQNLPVPDWHVAEVQRRLAAFAADGQRGRPVDEVLAELKRRP